MKRRRFQIDGGMAIGELDTHLKVANRVFRHVYFATIQFQLKRWVVERSLASRFETKCSGQSDITGNLQSAGLQILTVKLELIFAGGQVGLLGPQRFRCRRLGLQDK
jgi:hypothetical protein